MHSELQTLLSRRLEIIADHSFRDRDATAHLAALKDVSDKIQTYTQNHQAEFDAKLRHFLAQSSYQKALEHLVQAT